VRDFDKLRQTKLPLRNFDSAATSSVHDFDQLMAQPLNSTTLPIGSMPWLNSATLRLKAQLDLLALLWDIQYFPVDSL
jgi:hypothetical protein